MDNCRVNIITEHRSDCVFNMTECHKKPSATLVLRLVPDLFSPSYQATVGHDRAYDRRNSHDYIGN